MKFIVNGKNTEVSTALKERAIKKLGKIERFFKSDAECHITFEVEKNRHICEVTIISKGLFIKQKKQRTICMLQLIW